MSISEFIAVEELEVTWLVAVERLEESKFSVVERLDAAELNPSELVMKKVELPELVPKVSELVVIVEVGKLDCVDIKELEALVLISVKGVDNPELEALEKYEKEIELKEDEVPDTSETVPLELETVDELESIVVD